MEENTFDKEYLFLHIEGMDLAGKSTVSKLLAQSSRKDWSINDKRLNEQNPIYDFAWDSMQRGEYNSEILGFLYVSALINDIENFTLKTNIIQDSTLLLRSLNYYKTVKKNKELERVFSSTISKHPKPHKSFYLTADIETRRNRLAKRMEECPEKLSSMDMLIRDNPYEFMRIDESLKKLSVENFNSQVIDTSNMTELEIVEYIRDCCADTMTF